MIIKKHMNNPNRIIREREIFLNDGHILHTFFLFFLYHRNFTHLQKKK
jgi:hypothetical protein